MNAEPDNKEADTAELDGPCQKNLAKADLI